MRILVVDDDEFITEVLAAALKTWGYDAHPVNDADTALAHLSEEAFDLIITDYEMPGKNGAEITRFAVTNDLCPRVIGMSGLNRKEAFLECGAVAFVGKPIAFPLLKEMVEQALRPPSP